MRPWADGHPHNQIPEGQMMMMNQQMPVMHGNPYMNPPPHFNGQNQPQSFFQPISYQQQMHSGY